tara:strand:+ start:435 stop:2036 length:1602 start_codon:yes stop_codon:yes gene_type:complete
MAKSYYKQSERPEVEGINWGQIGTDLSNELRAEETRRTDLKAEIDKDSRDYISSFNDSPQGQHIGANERMAKFADNASQHMLSLNKRLRNGNIKLRDYNAQIANINQGTTDMFEVSKTFNKEFDANLLRINSGEASAEEIHYNKQLQDFSNPSFSDIYIDPVSSQISAAKMVDDGYGKLVKSSNPSEMRSVFSLKNTAKRKINNFKINEFSDKVKGSYNAKFQTILNKGTTGQITSMLKSEDFINATNYEISSVLTNPHNAATILTNRVQDAKGNTIKPYKFVTLSTDKLPEVKEEGVIYLVPNPTDPNSGASQPKLTPKQTTEATEILRTAINSKIGVEVTEFDEGKEARLEAKHESDMTRAKSTEEKQQIQIKYLDEKLRLGNDLLTKRLEKESKEGSTALKDFNTLVQSKYTLTAADIASDNDAAENLNNAYGDLRFKFEPAMAGGTQAVKIVSPEGEELVIVLDYPNAEQTIKNFINLNTPDMTIGRLSKSGSLTSGKKPTNISSKMSHSEWKKSNPNGTFSQYTEYRK